MSRIRLAVALFVALMCVTGGYVAAAPFEMAPESFAPVWWTSFPYQRNIDWDFSSDPTTTAPHYHGYDDAALSASDYVEFIGDVAWYATAPGTGLGLYNGVIGIDNRGGDSWLTGEVIFHIDNWDTPLIKHLWEEVDFNFENASITQMLDLPPDSVEIDAWFGPSWNIGTDPELWRQNIWYEIDPNPPWEEKIFEFTVGPGGFAFVDRFHIATECAIPEPATLSLIGLGLAGLAVARRKQKK